MTVELESIQMKTTLRNLSHLAFLGALLFSVNLVSAQTVPATTTTTTSTSTAGTINEFSPNTIVVKTTTSNDPQSYTYTKTTTYVDENGKAVAVDTVKSGLPVTVYYTKDGEQMVATKVVVRKTTTTATP